MAACPFVAPTTTKQVVFVTINQQGQNCPTVNADPIVITSHQSIRWVYVGAGTKWDVRFKDPPPFENGDHYHAGNHDTGAVNSGLREGSYSYRYSVEANGQKLDPTVIIKVP
jgi:hypothetical protein